MIDELSGAVADALSAGYEGPPNGRVRDVPDRRTIRYYTTLGLIDRPAEMRGRTAFYGRRHLLQVVAIKKLQARGRSLAEVQRALAGQTDKVLAQVAELGDRGMKDGDERAPERAKRDFWREAPAAHAVQEPEDARGCDDQRTDARPAETIGPQTFHGIPLVEGVTLLLASSRPIDMRDLEAIRTAAGPLIDILLHRQLIHTRAEGETP